MGVFKAAIITDNGNAMIANAVADIKTIRFSKVVVSSHEYPEDTVWSNLTTLDGIQQETTPTDVRISGTSQVGLRALFTNTNVSEKYKIQMIGIYATDGDSEVLFAISKALQVDEMPAYVGAAPSSFIYNISLIISRASAIQTTVDLAGTATVQDILALEEGISGLRVKIEKVYHDIIVTGPTPWKGSTVPYAQELTVPGIKVGDPAEMWSAVDETTAAADVKLWNKMASMIDCAQINADGKLTLICKNKKPTSEFKIRLKGVSGS